MKKQRANFLLSVPAMKALRKTAKTKGCTMTQIVERGIELAVSEHALMSTPHLGTVRDSSVLDALPQKGV